MILKGMCRRSAGVPNRPVRLKRPEVVITDQRFPRLSKLAFTHLFL